MRLKIVVRRAQDDRNVDLKQSLSQRICLLNISKLHVTNSSLRPQEGLSELWV